MSFFVRARGLFGHHTWFEFYLQLFIHSHSSSGSDMVLSCTLLFPHIDYIRDLPRKSHGNQIQLTQGEVYSLLGVCGGDGGKKAPLCLADEQTTTSSFKSVLLMPALLLPGILLNLERGLFSSVDLGGFPRKIVC